MSVWGMKQAEKVCVWIPEMPSCRSHQRKGAALVYAEPNTMVFGHTSDLNELQLLPSSWCKPSWYKNKESKQNPSNSSACPNIAWFKELDILQTSC